MNCSKAAKAWSISVRDLLGLFVFVFLIPNVVVPQDYDAALTLRKSGEYEKCLKMANDALAENGFSEKWHCLSLEIQLLLGQYESATTVGEKALEEYDSSVPLKYLLATAERYTGNEPRAKELLNEIELTYSLDERRFRNPSDQVYLAKFFLERGADPREVIGKFLQPLTKTDHAANITMGDLALSKSDYALAAEHFQRAVAMDPNDPTGFFGLVQAYRPSDLEKSQEFLQKTLSLNSRYVPALLWIAENKIDGEQYEDAKQILTQVLGVNPKDFRAIAFQAVIAHLNNDSTLESNCRDLALSTWSGNPEFDYLVGKKLSQKYRFVEGAEYQRRALVYDPKFLPAQTQLAQDQLRRGEELEGWKLADDVYRRDSYNILAHNLVTLRDSLAQYSTIHSEDFVIRMEAREAKLYGPAVLKLLTRAKAQLSKKYDFEISKPVYVEIFAKQQDFAVRTFGMPGGAGFLGVCFGNVITMNSPATQGNSPSNWQAVLWHEFCHVITLQKTNNKMPRWLSEGISVYEERLANPAWGQSMNYVFRRMILGDELTPVSKLSDAFLTPKSAEHLMFAYFEASLVVEYLVDKHGLEVLKRILVDLGLGTSANEALQHYVGSLEQFDKDFAGYIRQRAQSFGKDHYFEEAKLPDEPTATAMLKLVQDSPENFLLQQQYALTLIENEQWDEARLICDKLIGLLPEYTGSGSPYEMLSIIFRELGNDENELKALSEFVARDADAFDARIRLSELSLKLNHFPRAHAAASEALAINPLIPGGHNALAAASEKLGDDESLVQALAALVELEPLDPAAAHFSLAQTLFRLKRTPEAKREVLKSLEFAPRYRDAQVLLLEVKAAESGGSK